MAEISAPIEHPRRRALNDEVHARPPDSLPTPCGASYLACVPELKPDALSPTDRLAELLRGFDVEAPPQTIKHFTTRLGARRLRWERHTEYSRYTLIDTRADAAPFSGASGIPGDWLATMRGQILVGLHASIVEMPGWEQRVDEIGAEFFDGNVLIGSGVADRSAVALTDLRIHADGFSRVLLINDGMSGPQTGRVLQRLLDIETYRMMALLALPVAQELTPVLDRDEHELAAIGEALIDAESQQEQELLERLTRLSAGSQHRHLRSNYRFAAADAYYEIVLQRIHELREIRIPGLQTFEEFTTRRLTPAVKTCRAASRRQQSILEQMARATKLLSTRIDIARQQQNQSLLASMNRRVKAQLRLQATVEGLSVAAVTYYVVGLIGALADGLAVGGLALDKSIVMAASVPVVAAAVFLGVRRLRRRISREEAESR